MKTTRINFTTIKLTLLAILTGLFLTTATRAATFTVNSILDNGTGGCTVSECTLREAIVAANAAATADIINFDATVFNVARTITLSGTELTISGSTTNTLTIDGTSASLLTISGNNVSRVFSVSSEVVVIINALTITGGRSSDGGAITSSGNLTLNNLAVSNSVSTGNGGGITNDGTLTINNSTISGNSAQFTGGIINLPGRTLTINNSTISGNSAVIRDGGIYNFGTLNLNSSTISNNSAQTAGGIGNSGTANFNNSIIANSVGNDDCENFATVNAAYSLIEEGLTCVNGTNSNNLTGDPNLGPLANNGGPTQTHTLLGNSIAIDKGNSTLTTDQRGSARPIDLATYANAPGGNGSDIGAVELQIAPTATIVSIGGRVMVGKGRGLANARVYLIDQNGETRSATTNPFGYYRFNDLAAGQTVIITIVSKRYQFASQVVSVTEDIENLNFFAALWN